MGAVEAQAPKTSKPHGEEIMDGGRMPVSRSGLLTPQRRVLIPGCGLSHRSNENVHSSSPLPSLAHLLDHPARRHIRSCDGASRSIPVQGSGMRGTELYGEMGLTRPARSSTSYGRIFCHASKLAVHHFCVFGAQYSRNLQAPGQTWPYNHYCSGSSGNRRAPYHS